MGNRVMSEETKIKIAATRAANKASSPEGGKRATIEEQIAGLQAQSEAGDAAAQALLPVIEVYFEKVTQGKKDLKRDIKKLRKLLAV